MVSASAFGLRTRAEEVAKGHDLSGKTVVITGGNSGLGAYAAQVLAAIGARVIITSRKLAKGEEVAAAIQKSGPKGTVIVKQLDLADLKSVETFSADIKANEQRLDLLVLNAGVMACPKAYTKQNFEIQIGTNHFGHFHLAQQLISKMQAQSFPSRIIVLTSLGHAWAPPCGIDFEDMHWRSKPYKTWQAYGQSKLANVLFAKELAKRLQGSQVTPLAVHPGIVLETSLARNLLPMKIPGMGWLFTRMSSKTKSVPEGAATTVWAATAPGLEAHAGAYLEDCHVSQANEHGQDPQLAQKLWQSTEDQIQTALS